MALDLSASDLAERTAIAPQYAEATLHRIRSWTNAGALKTTEPPHQGAGRHRRYAPDEAYIAIVLNALAGNGATIGVIEKVATRIRGWAAMALAAPDDAFLDRSNGYHVWGALWRAARNQTQDVHIYVSAMPVGPASEHHEVNILIRSLAEGPPPILSGYMVYLTGLFRLLP